MKKLILLAGLHKTGTSSIQQTCVRERRLLAAKGIAYAPELHFNGQFTTEGNGNHTRLLRNAFRRAPRLEFQRSQQAAYDKLSRAIREALNSLLTRARADVVLMAAEGVSTFTAQELEDLNDFFQGCGYEVELKCCIRQPLKWLTSMVGQRVSGRFGPRLTIESAIQEFVDAGGIVVPRVQLLAKAFPQTDFYSFSAAVEHKHGVVGHFLERIGVEIDQGIEIVTANEGRSNHAVRLSSLLNGVIGPRGASARNDSFYRELHDRCPALWSIPGAGFSLLQDEVAPVLDTLVKENEWLGREFGPGFIDDTIALAKMPVLLDAAQRQFLMDNFASSIPPIKTVVDMYVAQH